MVRAARGRDRDEDWLRPLGTPDADNDPKPVVRSGVGSNPTGANMNFSKMKRDTLLKCITKYQLQVSPSLHTEALRHAVSAKFEFYLEDWFLRRVIVDVLPRCPGLKHPGRNQTHLPGSKLEFDFSWKSLKVAVEIHGGIDSRRRSGHTTPTGIKRDLRKCNLAQLHGWLLLQFTSEQINQDLIWMKETCPMLLQALKERL